MPHASRDIEELRMAVQSGRRAKYVFFWSHKAPRGAVTAACFSQWWPSKFEGEGHTYHSAEQYMMAEKAALFGDQEALARILATDSPGAAKRFGRSVVGFQDEVWSQSRWNIVVRGNLLKFSQNPRLAEYLIGTGNRVLVEASPSDRIWGIGLSAEEADSRDPEKWKGLNLLGFALMEVRSRIRESRPTCRCS